jgi:hypothetical protein
LPAAPPAATMPASETPAPAEGGAELPERGRRPARARFPPRGEYARPVGIGDPDKQGTLRVLVRRARAPMAIRGCGRLALVQPLPHLEIPAVRRGRGDAWRPRVDADSRSLLARPPSVRPLPGVATTRPCGACIGLCRSRSRTDGPAEVLKSPRCKSGVNLPRFKPGVNL